jgi:LPXTG-motif cell wall-anchored protein
MQLYLVPNAIADKVTSRDDPRLTPLGKLVPDTNGHGILTFRVPALKDGSYAAAAWCPGCARYSFGRTFFTLRVGSDIVRPLRPLMLLRVETGGGFPLSWPMIVGLSAVAAAALAGVILLRRRARPLLSAASVEPGP